MDKADAYEQSLTGLVIGTRDHVLAIRRELQSGPPGDRAVALGGIMNGYVRSMLADVELNAETLAAARRSGRDEGWGHGFARGYRAGLEAAASQAAGAGHMPPPHLVRAIAG